MRRVRLTLASVGSTNVNLSTGTPATLGQYSTMTVPRYGDASPGKASDDLTLDEIRRRGFAVVPAVLDGVELDLCRDAIDRLHVLQGKSLDKEQLASVGELDIVRAPLVGDDLFLFSVALQPRVHDLAKSVIGNYCLLHLQNAIVNRPSTAHHQSAWHRDLPYLDRTSSTPLAMSALFCIDEFTVETGATWCLPGSHVVAEPPSDNFLALHAVPIEANAGDVIVFDSMLVHRAGINESSKVRRGINNVYSVGIIRQQIDLPRALDGRFGDDPQLAIFLGYTSNAPVSAEDYQRQRLRRHAPT